MKIIAHEHSIGGRVEDNIAGRNFLPSMMAKPMPRLSASNRIRRSFNPRCEIPVFGF
jgi:hypothetical protein